MIVDGARMPVYFAMETRGMLAHWPVLVTTIAGVLVGTFWGGQLLRRIDERTFRKFLYSLILALGVYMLIHGAMAANSWKLIIELWPENFV